VGGDVDVDVGGDGDVNVAEGDSTTSQDGTTGPDSLGVGYATDREDL
jgi:hypothetical protein